MLYLETSSTEGESDMHTEDYSLLGDNDDQLEDRKQYVYSAI